MVYTMAGDSIYGEHNNLGKNGVPECKVWHPNIDNDHTCYIEARSTPDAMNKAKRLHPTWDIPAMCDTCGCVLSDKATREDWDGNVVDNDAYNCGGDCRKCMKKIESEMSK